MRSILNLPSELLSVIGTEEVEFSVIAKRRQPIKKSLGIIVFGILWTAFTSVFVIAFLGPIFKGEEVHFKANGVPTTASWDNFEPLLVPSLIIGLFATVGIGMLLWGLYCLYQKGGYFVGTVTRLISYYKGTIRSYDWEQFSGNIEINNNRGDITLQLRTGKMVNRKNTPNKFIPDLVYISGTTTILAIEKICRERIKENDPTPANLI